MKLLQILTLCLLMTSCAMAHSRVDLIEQNSDLVLPDNYTVIRDTREPARFAGSDHLIIVQLEFDPSNFEQLMQSFPENSDDWQKVAHFYKFDMDLSKDEGVSIVIDQIAQSLLYRQGKKTL